MNKTRVRFTVAYDGTNYCGWQRQNQGPLPSLSQTLERALETVFKEEISLFASGRTDAGVHAFNQVCHFDTSWSVEKLLKWDLGWALKPHLPDSIVVKRAWVASMDFHATISATHKTYKYFVHNRLKASPFLRKHCYWERHPIDLDHLQMASRFLIGEKDFKSFQSVGTDMPYTVREIYQAQWVQKRPHLLEFTITGSGFLKQMVRNIVGTQLFLQRKNQPPEKIKEIIEAMDRKKAGPPAPPEGLFLYRVYYPEELNRQCQPMKFG